MLIRKILMITRRSLRAPISALMLAVAASPCAVLAGGDDVAPPERYEREDRYTYREYVPPPQPRTVYVIIRERPVPRLVYAAPAGGYYCIEGGRRVMIHQPCYTTLPRRYVSYGYRGHAGGRYCY